MKFSATLRIVALATLLASAGHATVPPAQNNGNNNGAITILGTVQSVNNQREFMLQSPDGNFNVQMTTRQSLNLQPGEPVVVSGTLENGYNIPVIKATTVRSKRDRGQALDQALRSLPNSTTNLNTANKIRPQPANQVAIETAPATAQTSDGIQLRTTAHQPQRNDLSSVSDSYSTQNNRLTAITGSTKNNTARPDTITNNNISDLVGQKQPPQQ